jgi:GntR family transcriptional repressor for pyruvate dehydrogenase complex
LVKGEQLKAQPKDFLKPVDHTTLTTDVCRRLITHLVRGDWHEGERIPSERELGGLLGVGRASLREALKALEIMGMLEVRVGDGTFVCERSQFLSRPLLWAVAGSAQAHVQELIEARRVLEKGLAALAAERATAEDLAQIGKYQEEMEKAGGNVLAFLEADLNFHLAVARAARNRILLNAVQMMRNLMRQWISETVQVHGVSDRAIQQHKVILLAIAKKDRAKASAAMEAHLSAMGDVLRKVEEAQTRHINEPA